MDKESMKRLSELVQMTRELLEKGIDADQIIVAETAKSNVYHFENHLFLDGKVDTRFPDEEAFMEMLKEKGDCALKYIVCMWKNGAVEIPSMHFRKMLMEASHENGAAMYVVHAEDEKGELVLGVRTVSRSMPPAKKVDAN